MIRVLRVDWRLIFIWVYQRKSAAELVWLIANWQLLFAPSSALLQLNQHQAGDFFQRFKNAFSLEGHRFKRRLVFLGQFAL
jgi:hypothetical protein